MHNFRKRVNPLDEYLPQLEYLLQRWMTELQASCRKSTVEYEARFVTYSTSIIPFVRVLSKVALLKSFLWAVQLLVVSDVSLGRFAIQKLQRRLK